MIKKIKKIKEQINNLGLSIVGEDFTKPWGGFLIIDENQSKKFISHFIYAFARLCSSFDFM